MTRKNPRLAKYRRPLNINIGVIIFSVAFIYILISIVLFMTKDKTNFYEVVEGKSASSMQKYTGIALREEKIAYADRNGYINYYVREGNRVNVTTTLYTLDESGMVKSMLEDASDDSMKLSESNLSSIKDQISSFSSEFQDMKFDRVYDFRYDLESSILEYMNSNALDSINKKLASSGKSDQFEIQKANSSGVVVYSVDNFEQKSAKDLKKEDFDFSKYKKANFTSDKMIEKGSPIYKTISNETWNIVIPLTKEQSQLYADTESVSVKFKKDNIETTGAFELLKLSDGTYGKITLNNYMTRYALERFIDIELQGKEITGLKVPKKSVVEKEFYLIPVNYAKVSQEEKSVTFKLEKDEDGKTSTEQVKPTIYGKTDKYYLVDQSTFKTGDVIIRDDNSTDRYVIGKSKKLKGVYNINSGYTVFREITVLAEANDYYIVESGNNYGLTIYDHIVLDGDSVKENQIISQ